MKRLWKLAATLATCAVVVAAGIKVSVEFRTPKADAQAPPSQLNLNDKKVPPELINAGAANFKKHSKWAPPGSVEPGRYSVSANQESNWSLEVTTPDGTTRTVETSTPVVLPIPIPGTNQIAFSGLGNNTVPYPMYVVNADGSNLHQVGTTNTPWRYQVTEKGLLAFREGKSLVVHDVISGNRRLIPGVELDGTYPTNDTLWAISPDASKIALRQGDDLLLIDLNSGTRRTVSGPLDRRRETVGTWSPDGKLFAYATDARTRDDQSAVWVVGLQSEPQLLFKYPNQTKGMFWNMAWADDTAVIVNYVPNGSMSEAIPQTEYYIVTTKGGGKFLFKNGFGLKVSRDGKNLYVQRQTKVDSITDFALWQADILR